MAERVSELLTLDRFLTVYDRFKRINRRLICSNGSISFFLARFAIDPKFLIGVILSWLLDTNNYLFYFLEALVVKRVQQALLLMFYLRGANCIVTGKYQFASLETSKLYILVTIIKHGLSCQRLPHRR